MTKRLYAYSIYDPDTGLYKIGARWYDPVIGVWLTPDSIVPDVNNPLAWNRYAFNYQNPVQYVDPSGHFAIPAGLLLIAAVGFLGGEIYAASQGYNALDLEFWQYSGQGALLTTSAYLLAADVALMAGVGLQGAGLWFNSTRLFSMGMHASGLGGAMYAWAFQPLQFRRSAYWKAEYVGGGGGGGGGRGNESGPFTRGKLPPGGEWVDIEEIESIHAADSLIYPRGAKRPISRAEYYARKIANEGFDLRNAIPVVKTPAGRIIQTEGHHRLAALRILGWRQAPIQPDLTVPPGGWRAFVLLADEFKKYGR